MFKLNLMVLLVLLQSYSFANAQVIEMTGVATIENTKAQHDVERLRERAMRNAMELALLHVKGGEISSSKSTLDTYTEERKSINNKNTDSTLSRNASQSGARTRTNGNVRIVKLIKEWRDQGAYYVKLKVSVDEIEDSSANVGSSWQRIGRPTISLTSVAYTNGKLNKQNVSLGNYIANDLSMNQLDISSAGSRINIHIEQNTKVNRFSEFNTYSASCEVLLSIQDKDKERSVSNNRLRAGPKAGFSLDEAEKKCVAEVAQTLSHDLISELASIFNNEWNNGKEYLISFHRVPGNKVPIINEVVENAYLMKSAQFRSYKDNMLSLVADYRGTEVELIDAISAAFLLEGESVELKTMTSNKISFELQNDNN